MCVIVCICNENSDQTLDAGYKFHLEKIWSWNPDMDVNKGSGGSEMASGKEEEVSRGGSIGGSVRRSAHWCEWGEYGGQNNAPPSSTRWPAVKMFLYMAKGTTDILGQKSKRIYTF